jgi:hypothetical protein
LHFALSTYFIADGLPNRDASIATLVLMSVSFAV